MKKLFVLALSFVFSDYAFSQCTTTNATSCECLDPSQTNCDLLPDITISWEGILNYMGGPNEYPQLCNPACNGNDGRLRLSASTPNIGMGPLTVRGSNFFVCGTDTFTSNPGTCTDGSTPRQLITQRVYHKNGNAMTYTDRWAGGMTYHQSHGHNHVDDWGVFTLRIEDPNEPDPRNWPVVAEGGKLGFCLMDYYQCGDASAVNHCKDVNTVYNQGNSLVNADFPNFGLGGGSYSCSTVEQGISSGYTDVYSEALDLMWINLPPDLCNGQYWIVIVVDPHNSFLESDETNNYTAVPFTITQQNSPGTAQPVKITCNKPSPRICPGDSIMLTATAGSSIVWNTGETSQSIWVNTPGNYSATVTNYCGTGTSANYKVSLAPAPSVPVTSGDTICSVGVCSLSATGSGTLTWTDANGQYLATGNSYTTPTISNTTIYYVTSEQTFTDTTYAGPATNAFGTGSYLANTQYLSFTTVSPVKLISVKVYAQTGGTQTIQLRDSTGSIINTTTVTVPAGESRVNLNWNIPVVNGWRLTGATVNNLYRNNTNSTNYPYTVNGALSITGSSAGPAYYYYFYDWEIETQYRSCSTAPVPVNAVVYNCTGIDDRDLNQMISIQPNPANEFVYLNVALPGTGDIDIAIRDIIGKTVYRKNLTGASGNHQELISLEELSNGSYLMQITIAGRSYNKKLIVRK